LMRKAAEKVGTTAVKVLAADEAVKRTTGWAPTDPIRERIEPVLKPKLDEFFKPRPKL
jgi:hypothetical protein